MAYKIKITDTTPCRDGTEARVTVRTARQELYDLSRYEVQLYEVHWRPVLDLRGWAQHEDHPPVTGRLRVPGVAAELVAHRGREVPPGTADEKLGPGDVWWRPISREAAKEMVGEA